ncbi:hypothetical protein [Actinocorallia herbida]|uniref:hypothetical protein n=1 Tax=Actinocorallia herbida TaxID=58109 RepID=UPI0014772A4F|nr:hypothetical protein [Actinocorallia herbida]
MNEAGLGPVVAHGDILQPSGEHSMNRLLSRRPDLDAVLVASDLMALGASGSPPSASPSRRWASG